jgi:hypothetical protein
LLSSNSLIIGSAPLTMMSEIIPYKGEHHFIQIWLWFRAFWHCRSNTIHFILLCMYIYDLDESMSVLHFEKYNLLSLIKIWKTSMPTGFFIWGYMYPFTFIFGGTSTFLGVQCTPRLARGKPVRLQIFMTSQELKNVLCGNILDSLKQKMQLKPT